jgi:hypothetical protein
MRPQTSLFQKTKPKQDNGERYALVFKYSNGEVGVLKPLACDNPASPYGFSDRAILRKAKKLAKELTKKNDDLECRVEEY